MITLVIIGRILLLSPVLPIGTFLLFGLTFRLRVGIALLERSLFGWHYELRVANVRTIMTEVWKDSHVVHLTGTIIYAFNNRATSAVEVKFL
jgi:hypothetical protein